MAWNGNGLKNKGVSTTTNYMMQMVVDTYYPSVDGYKFFTTTTPSGNQHAYIWAIKYDKDPALYFKAPAMLSSTSGKTMCVVAK